MKPITDHSPLPRSWEIESPRQQARRLTENRYPRSVVFGACLLLLSGFAKWGYGGWTSVFSVREAPASEVVCNLRMVPVKMYVSQPGWTCGTRSIPEPPVPAPAVSGPPPPDSAFFCHTCLAELEEVPQPEISPFLTFEEEEDMNQQIPEVYAEPQYPAITDFMIEEIEPYPLNMHEIKKLIGYPQIARDAGIMGTVVVRVLVDKNGAYQRHKVIKSVHPILDQAVEAQLHKLRFEPALQGGKPIPYWVNIPFKFCSIN
jgi:protein TonB